MRLIDFRLVALPVLALALAGCSSQQQEAGKRGAATAGAVKGVTLETVTTTTLAETLEVPGTVRAMTSAVVSSRIPGVIASLKAREGDRVRKGQLLIQLDAMENLATAAAASAGVEEARRGFEEAQARKKLADATFDRYQNLYNEQAITRQEFEVRQTDRELALQGVARAEARLKQAQEGARAAGTMADHTRIIAPVSGVITARQVDSGSTVFPGQPLMTIEGEGGYQLELAVPESHAAKIKPGTPATVTLDALQQSFNARIAEVVPAADPLSRTFIAKIPLSQTGLKSGMFGRASLSSGTSVRGIIIPRKALFERGALTAVWTVDGSNIVQMRLVKPGKETGDRIVILAGLAEGDRLVIAGAEKLTEGLRIEP